MTKFKDIKFDYRTHQYTIGSQQLTSVTSLLEKLKPVFDRDQVSRNVMKKDGRSQKEILADWENASIAALDKGNRLHQYIEDVFDGKIDPTLRATNDRIPEMEGFDEAWKRLQSSFGAKVVQKEFVIGDSKLGVAGKLDVMLHFKSLKTAHIFDWKTGQFKVSNNYQNLYAPFDTEPDCHLVNYSLQISLYRLIIERNLPDLKISDGYILHLRPDGTFMLYRVIDYRERLLQWLDNGIPDDFRFDSSVEKDVKSAVNYLHDLDFGSISKKLRLSVKQNLELIANKLKE